MDRSDSVGSSDRVPSPVSSTNSSPESSPPPSPSGPFRGRDASLEDPIHSIRSDDSVELPQQAAEKLKKRKFTIREMLGSMLGFKSKEKRRGSDPVPIGEAGPTITGPQHDRPLSADADVLMKAQTFQKIRQRNREGADRDSNLDDLSSLGSLAFFAATGVSASTLSPIEKEILQDELRGYLESKINKGEPNLAFLSKELIGVIRESMPTLQLAPNTAVYMKRQRGQASHAHCIKQLSVQSTATGHKALEATFGAAINGVMYQLRVPVFDKLFEGATAEEQAVAYERLQDGATNVLATLNMLKEKLERTDDHEFVVSMLEDVEHMIGLVQDQQQVLKVLRKQDFRNQQNYIAGAEVLLDTAQAMFDPDKVSDKHKDAAREARVLVEVMQQNLKLLPPGQLRPNVIGDLKKLEKSLLETAEKLEMGKVFKKELSSARSKKGWEPIENLIPVRHGVVTKLYKSRAVPLGVMMGEPGTGVPSTAQHVIDKPCNAFVCESRAPDGKLTSRYMRSAVPDPYKADENFRKVGGQRRAELQIAGALLAEFGNNADLLEQAYGSKEQAAGLHIMLESFLTTDQFRARTGIHDNEVDMNARAYDNFDSLTMPDGSPRPVIFTDANGKTRKIYIKKPEVALISCGSNALALNPTIQFFTRS